MMPNTNGRAPRRVLAAAIVIASISIAARQDRAGTPQFPGGTNPDGSLRPSAPLTRLFTQDAYTEYALLAPATASFRIMFLPEETRPGATELINATRGGSEGSGIEVYDPRTGKPLPFTYAPQGSDPDSHAIRATLPRPVPEGGIGRALIYKTYKDPRPSLMNVAAQVTTTDEGRLKLGFANPSGQANPVTIHARPTDTVFTPSPFTDMFFDDIKTLYDLDDPETGRIAIEQTYSDHRPGERARLDSLAYLPLQDLRVVDLDTAIALTPLRSGGATFVKLDVPIENERQSAHLKITGTLRTPSYAKVRGELVFQRTLRGLRNTILLPAGWDLSAVSQSGTIGTYHGRTFVALINLNAENRYNVTIRARRATAAAP